MTKASTQNIDLYERYLTQKVEAFRDLRKDYIKLTATDDPGRLRQMTVSKGLLKDTAVLQKQLAALLKCKFHFDSGNNEISLYAYRLVLEELLTLSQAINEAVVNILEHYFAMNKADATTSLEIYKRFAKQTEETALFVESARKFQGSLGMSVPILKHAPLSLAAALEEYLNDPGTDTPQIQVPEQTEIVPATAPQHRSIDATNKPVIDFFASLEKERPIAVSTQPPDPFLPTVQPQSYGDINPFRTGINPQQMGAPSQFGTGINLQPTGVPSQFGTGINIQPTGVPSQFGTGIVSQPTNTLTRSMSVATDHMAGSTNPFRSNTMPMPTFNNTNQNMWCGTAIGVPPQPSGTMVVNPFVPATNNSTMLSSSNPFSSSQYNSQQFVSSPTGYNTARF
ncbi:hypothetical protein DFQ28_003640 [Apophysomyces sp. BC1034]|nr:hypothetical protein DFQ30_001836 [Apophysomyces sp. BC1015]KAG0193720.1 hypothetical protein DFQ28_003640 [Apophysomyces sp. BC1034]